MARARKSTTELPAQADPKAPLDVQAFLKAAQPVLAELTEDLLRRADADRGITKALKARHAAETKQRRTSDTYAVWRRTVMVQVAAAWLLSCVFVRTLEDRGLLDRNRVAGRGAVDSQELFHRVSPHLGEREYLMMVFRELERFVGVRELFDVEHNLLWQLGPSSQTAKALLALFRGLDAEQPPFRFGQESTRFLGDLYQDLSEDVRKRYALLQTPDFIESFILDRTLTPAIQAFGLEYTTLIDPTCGSGHFLLGAFERLYDRWCAEAPTENAQQTVERALNSVFGVDINPYAVSIARFRLMLAALDKLGVERITEAQRMPLNVVAGDSLWQSLKGVELEFFTGEVDDEGPSRFRLLDQATTRRMLEPGFAVVVGNPPYITEKNPALREAYREVYDSAAGKYALSAPFMERFFQIGRRSESGVSAAFIGQITANSFMKREFGKALIQQVLPRYDLTTIINTSGAYIPGHGTPTVLVFGRRRTPELEYVHAVLARRGEPCTPEVAAQGVVWRSIEEHWDEEDFENDYITVQKVERKSLGQHPWSLEGGGAGDIKALLEQRAKKRLGSFASVGIFGMTNADDCMLMNEDAWKRTTVEPRYIREIGIGEDIRDWSSQTQLRALYPYDWPATLVDLEDVPGLHRYLWPFRTILGNRATFGGGTYFRDGLPWWKWHQVTADRIGGALIAFAEVATHNHFVLDRGGKVFKQTAPIIKLPSTATEDDHLALIAYLNSSTVCFFLKSVSFAKANHTEERPEKFEPGTIRYAFNATNVASIPIPDDSLLQTLVPIARNAESISHLRGQSSPRCVAFEIMQSESPVAAAIDQAQMADAKSESLLIGLQERIDWTVYCWLHGESVTIDWPVFPEELSLTVGQRPFSNGDANAPDHINKAAAAIRASKMLAMLETVEYKRRWVGAGRGSFAQGARTFKEACIDWLSKEILSLLEEHLKTSDSPVQRATLLASLRANARNSEVLDYLARTLDLFELISGQGVPYLPGLYLNPAGVEKRADWRRTWDLQRREDAGEKVGDIPVPPKYDQKDYRDAIYWRLRGKLDVPTERFISYPGCESDKDQEPVYGWAGWDHAQRAQALANLYLDRKNNEAWSRERLTPMLAGIAELLPWLKQWHADPHPDFGEPLSDFYATWLEGELREHKLTLADLEAWRPAGRSARKTGAPKQIGLLGDDEDEAPKPSKKTAKKKAAKPAASADAPPVPETPKTTKKKAAKQAANADAPVRETPKTTKKRARKHET